MNEVEDFYLQHHGVKGMKWGIRKKRETKGRSKSSAPIEYHKESNKTIKTNRDGSQTVPKGFVFNRVGQNDLDINAAGALYVSHGKADAARYVKALGPTMIGKLMGQYGTTVQHLTVKSDLKMPSEETLVKGSAKTLLDPKSLTKFNDSLYSMMATGQVENAEVTPDDVNRAIKNPKALESRRLAYGVSQCLANGEFTQEAKRTYDYFRKEGYDAIPDMADRNTGTSETAMIVINPNKVEMKSKTLITKDVMKAGKRYVKEAGKLKVSELGELS